LIYITFDYTKQMSIDIIINNILKEKALKSNMTHKHACIAINKGCIISPAFHNYMRSYIFNYNCGCVHAEIAIINYLINNICKINQKIKKQTYYRFIHNQQLTDKQLQIIKKFQKKCSKIDLVIIKQSKTATHLGNSRPCSECIKIMKMFKFNKVYYTNTHGNISIERISKMNSNHKTQIQISFENKLFSKK
jgi:hypothetical protein